MCRVKPMIDIYGFAGIDRLLTIKKSLKDIVKNLVPDHLCKIMSLNTEPEMMSD